MITNDLTHEQIGRDSLVEQYVRHQLDLEQRERFEVHFCECDECFEQVQNFERFLAGIRYAAGRGMLHAPPRRWVTPAFALAIAAVLIAAIALSLRFTPGKSQPPLAMTERQVKENRVREQMKSILDPASPIAILEPGREAEVAVPAESRPILLWFETPSVAAEYRIVVTPQGLPPMVIDHLRRDPQAGLSVSVPANSLPAGRTVISLSASDVPEKQIAEYTLLVVKP